MQRLGKLFIALLVSGGILPFLSTSAQAQRFITCSSTVTISGNLAAAAATASRTLFVKGTCLDNVTVRNLRVIIDGQNQTTLKPLDPLKAAITLRGGTTEATIQRMIIETGENPQNASTGGTSCNTDGNTVKGGDGIDIRDYAQVSVGQAAAFDVPAHPATGGGTIAATPDIPGLGNTINVMGAGRGIRVRNGANATLNGNIINGNIFRVNGSTTDVKCAGTLAKSFKGSTGIDVSSGAIVALGILVNQTPDLLVGGTVIDNRNTVTGNDVGLACAQGTVTGIKAPTSNPAGANGTSLITGNQTSNATITAPVVTSQALYNKNCFTDE